ncbi:MAG: hypothetical protein ACOY4K_05345 [Pseudomonadota bacterium]
MPAIIEPPPEEGDTLAPLPARLAWFAGLAALSALAVAAAAYVLRALLV